jgi:hypothetical protein
MVGKKNLTLAGNQSQVTKPLTSHFAELFSPNGA